MMLSGCGNTASEDSVTTILTAENTAFRADAISQESSGDALLYYDGETLFVLYEVAETEKNVYTLCKCSDDGAQETIFTYTLESEQHIEAFVMRDDGSAALGILNYDDESTTGQLDCVDETGTLLFSEDIGETTTLQMELDGDGNVVMLSGTLSSTAFLMTPYVLSPDGTQTAGETTEDYQMIDHMAHTPDGVIYVLCSAADGSTELCEWNSETQSLEETDIDLSDKGTITEILSSNAADILCDYVTDDGIYSIASDGTITQQLNFSASNLTRSDFLDGIGCSDGTFYALLHGSSGNYLAKLNETDADVVTQTLMLATFVINSRLENMVSDYNQSQDACRVEIVDYSTYNLSGDDYDWSLGLEQLNVDMAAGNAPDLLNVYGIDLYTYAYAGTFTDLYSQMETDTDYPKDSFLSGYLTANEVDGALYWLSPVCEIETLAANADLTGGLECWDLTQYLELCQTCNENVIEVYAEQAPTDILFVYQDLLDRSESTCYFDDDRFLKILEYTSEMTDYRIDTTGLSDTESFSVQTEESEKWNNGQRLIQQLTISDIGDYTEIKTSEVPYTLIGYPTRDGENGTYYTETESMFAIPANCKNTDAAWDFITSTLDVVYDDGTGMSYPGLPVVISYLEQYIYDEIAMLDAESLETQGLNDFSEADLMELIDYMNSITKSSVWDCTIQNTVLDELGEFTSGSQSAADTVDLIQQKVGLYLKENA